MQRKNSWRPRQCASPRLRFPALGCVDEIISEPSGGVHTDHETGAGLLGTALKRHLAELKSMSIDALVAARQEKFRKIAQFYTEG